VTADAQGFQTLKREGLVIEVGHSPTLDLTLSVGAETSVVEVTAEGPQIDVTSVTTQTNISRDVLSNVPTGRSFQSVIQFAPGASNEPLMGNTYQSNGSGSGSRAARPTAIPMDTRLPAAPTRRTPTWWKVRRRLT